MNKGFIGSFLSVWVLFSAVTGCSGGNNGNNDAGTDGGFTPGSRTFLESCTDDVDCEPGPGATEGICQIYMDKNQRLCTRSCTTGTAATDCPAPSTGCNNQGVCKAP